MRETISQYTQQRAQYRLYPVVPVDFNTRRQTETLYSSQAAIHSLLLYTEFRPTSQSLDRTSNKLLFSHRLRTNKANGNYVLEPVSSISKHVNLIAHTIFSILLFSAFLVFDCHLVREFKLKSVLHLSLIHI